MDRLNYFCLPGLAYFVHAHPYFCRPMMSVLSVITLNVPNPRVIIQRRATIKLFHSSVARNHFVRKLYIQYYLWLLLWINNIARRGC